MKSSIKWTLIAGGALLLGGPTLGVLGTILGMTFGFQTLGSAGLTDHETLASAIGASLLSTGIGVGIGVIGIVVLIIGVIMWILDRQRPALPPLETNSSRQRPE